LVLQQQAIDLQQRLEAINAELFQTMRAGIQAGRYTRQQLRQEFDQYTAYRADQPGQAHLGHEGLDVLVRGILETEPLPPETEPPGEEMIHFERTPASAILEMIDRAGFSPGRIFYDLGSGLGQVVILVNLLTSVWAKGIEIEPAYHAYAQQSALKLGLEQVVLLNADARNVNYNDGDIFFLFTPFTGSLLQTVLDKLRDVARIHSITICTYGPCTLTVAQQPWLNKLNCGCFATKSFSTKVHRENSWLQTELTVDEHDNHEFKVAIFRSA
jgi:SAM-dependent methyltransferase